MKSPIDSVKGRIVGYDEKRQELLIRAPYDDYVTMTRREYKTCLVQLVDSRPLSDKQRRMCYALLREISDFTGQSMASAKEWLKIKFLADDLQETADKIFSLSSAPMSLICAFQQYLIRFMLEFDIPCRFSLLEYADDIPDYIYSCLLNRKCCICGKPADLHHHDRVGNGRDRNEIDHEGMLAQPLCRDHHIECHTMPQAEFDERYKLCAIPIDTTLKRIWRLNGERKRYDQTKNRSGRSD